MANLMLSLKTALISTGVISVAVLLKASAPSVTEFITSGIPSTYGLLLSFLRPPYLYLLINGIIITIVASSKLQSQKPETSQHKLPSQDVVFPAAVEAVNVSNEVYNNNNNSEFSTYGSHDMKVVVTEESKGAAVLVVNGGDKEEVKEVVAVAPSPLRTESMELVALLNDTARKPPVSRRFAQRKAVKAASEGKFI